MARMSVNGQKDDRILRSLDPEVRVDGLGETVSSPGTVFLAVFQKHFILLIVGSKLIFPLNRIVAPDPLCQFSLGQLKRIYARGIDLDLRRQIGNLRSDGPVTCDFAVQRVVLL